MIKKNKKSKMTLDKLAVMIAGSFEGFEKRITEKMATKEDLANLENSMATNIEEVKTKIEGLGRRVDDLSDNRVKYTEFNGLKKRVDILEKKI